MYVHQRVYRILHNAPFIRLKCVNHVTKLFTVQSHVNTTIQDHTGVCTLKNNTLIYKRLKIKNKTFLIVIFLFISKAVICSNQEPRLITTFCHWPKLIYNILGCNNN